ncbi:hypothetical protein EVAR_67979_1 [Eumeta japonica]|uniref:Uncharacterized protein n=1 Tax=Eumeta variegata TaxID=151549 RepID=A0A4C1SB61_EUMVA|nr:hypothetical protein EVAR_67979_1 [Eumeta japonica]
MSSGAGRSSARGTMAAFVITKRGGGSRRRPRRPHTRADELRGPGAFATKDKSNRTPRVYLRVRASADGGRALMGPAVTSGPPREK